MGSSSSSVETKKGHVQNVNNVKKFSSSSSSNHSITTSIDMTTFLQTKEKDENDVLWLNQIDAMIESVICKCGDIDDMNLKVIQSGPSESRNRNDKEISHRITSYPNDKYDRTGGSVRSLRSASSTSGTLGTLNTLNTSVTSGTSGTSAAAASLKSAGTLIVDNDMSATNIKKK